MSAKRFMALALGCAALLLPACLAAQQEQESLADLARKTQAGKKNAPPAKMVIDNDNLGTLTGTVNVVGGAAGGDQKKSDQGASGPQGKDEAAWRQKFADANKKLADDTRELDITQRERNLKQEQFYADPMAGLKQEYSRQDLNDAKSKIDELQGRINQDKADIANLEDELRQAGGDPGWATAPSQPAAQGQSGQQTQPAQPAQPAGAADTSQQAQPSQPAAPAPAAH